MYKQTCKHCNNVVIGEFSPSNTRKILTSIAKKGGMKAVLAYVGSVFPGLGTVSGFLVGWGIDFIYGKDIDKFINKIADEVSDEKIYVFKCPNCDYTWSCKEEDLIYSIESVRMQCLIGAVYEAGEYLKHKR